MAANRLMLVPPKLHSCNAARNTRPAAASPIPAGVRRDTMEMYFLNSAPELEELLAQMSL